MSRAEEEALIAKAVAEGKLQRMPAAFVAPTQAAREDLVKSFRMGAKMRGSSTARAEQIWAMVNRFGYTIAQVARHFRFDVVYVKRMMDMHDGRLARARSARPQV